MLHDVTYVPRIIELRAVTLSGHAYLSPPIALSACTGTYILWKNILGSLACMKISSTAKDQGGRTYLESRKKMDGGKHKVWSSPYQLVVSPAYLKITCTFWE
jgi:hypothetical protein